MKRYLMEMLGTFFLISAVGFTGDPFAIGFMLMVLTYVGYHVSGGHYNPAVTLAVWLRGRLSRADVLPYMGSQVAGALVGMGVIYFVTDGMGLREPLTVFPLYVGCAFELALSFLFLMAVLVVATSSPMGTDHMQGVPSSGVISTNYIYGMAIGFALMAVSFLGAAVNPAIGLSSAVFSWLQNFSVMSLQGLLRSVGAPLVGSILAAHAFKYFYPDMHAMHQKKID